MFVLFSVFQRDSKGRPQTQRIYGVRPVRVPWRGGSRRGVSCKILYVYAFCRGLTNPTQYPEIRKNTRLRELSEDFSLLVAFLLVTFSWLFRGFFVVFSWLFRGPLLSRKTVFGPFSLPFRGFFVVFSWLFRGPRFGQILRVLALEQSSETYSRSSRGLLPASLCYESGMLQK